MKYTKGPKREKREREREREERKKEREKERKREREGRASLNNPDVRVPLTQISLKVSYYHTLECHQVTNISITS